MQLPIRLEDILEFNPEEVPLAIIDLRVHVFHLIGHFNNHAERLLADDTLRKEWIQASWAKLLNSPLPWLRKQPHNGWRVIVVDDTKYEEGNYWRNNILKGLGLPEYKGNRDYEARPDYYYELHESALEYLQQDGFPMVTFKQIGFEADDFAGLAYRLKPEDGRSLFLCTVDTDWSQLVCDKKRILFASTRNYAPRLRTEYEVLMWAYKSGYIIERPSDIVSLKVKYGDESDNLFANSPRGVICLAEPTELPNESHSDIMLRELKNGVPNTSMKHYKIGENWLLRNGF